MYKSYLEKLKEKTQELEEAIQKMEKSNYNNWIVIPKKLMLTKELLTLIKEVLNVISTERTLKNRKDELISKIEKIEKEENYINNIETEEEIKLYSYAKNTIRDLIEDIKIL